MNTRSSFDTEALDFSMGDMVRGLIEQRLIIGYGTVCDVPADGVVTVLFSVAKSEASATIVTCPYASSIMTSSLALDVKPKLKDKVILLSPQLFDSGMFSKEQTETVIKKMAFGYSPFACIAVPATQFKEGEYHNVVTVDDGKITASLAYDEENETNHLLLSTNESGEVSLRCADKDGEYQANLDITADGKAVYSNPKVSVTVGDDGSFEVKNENATVTISSDGSIQIQTKGKFTFKNDTTDLKTVLSELKKEIYNLKTVGSPATQSTSPATQALLDVWESTKLSQLLE